MDELCTCPEFGQHRGNPDKEQHAVEETACHAYLAQFILAVIMPPHIRLEDSMLIEGFLMKVLVILLYPVHSRLNHMAGNKRENAELKSQVDCEQHQCE
eukprot:CAMPEP_0172678542 /NCGR_PEP_ID=MMETSP1074-20121228/15480_1 /TAXON_ID=2916 /ORGANISM="Ceratium fusus, Strain PA161109" /LENGTH=98 /DNA_ID=CAMNT_0013496605 /DNA_START=122 /DNA_END=415 /DNA_ORIENTATION=-